MDNINRSYFIYKSKIKNRVKEAFKEIQEWEESIEILKFNMKNLSPENKMIEKQVIKICIEIIDDIKQKVKMETNIYLY